MYHGVINIYKEQGYTSHDVVAKLRGILKQKKSATQGLWTRRRREFSRSAWDGEPDCATC